MRQTVSSPNRATESHGKKLPAPAERKTEGQNSLNCRSLGRDSASPPAILQSDGRLIVSPIAARMAAENAIDLKTVTGTGPNGRIIKRDIEAAMGSGQPSRPSQPAFTPSTVVGASAYHDENTSQMRRVIASRLAESIGPIPTFYLTVEIEMDNALDLRKQVNASRRRRSKDQRQRHCRKGRGDVARQTSICQCVLSGQDDPLLPAGRHRRCGCDRRRLDHACHSRCESERLS